MDNGEAYMNDRAAVRKFYAEKYGDMEYFMSSWYEIWRSALEHDVITEDQYNNARAVMGDEQWFRARND